MSENPARLWLQAGDDAAPAHLEWGSSRTWCDERQGDGCTEYVRADLLPTEIEVFRICEHCNKEYRVPLPHLNKAGVRGAVHNFGECPRCGRRDDVWLRLTIVPKSEPTEMCEWCDRPVNDGWGHGEGQCFSAETGEPLPRPTESPEAPESDVVLGWRCQRCGHRLAFAASHCPQCLAELTDEPPESWPDNCQCTRCIKARGET